MAQIRRAMAEQKSQVERSFLRKDTVAVWRVMSETPLPILRAPDDVAAVCGQLLHGTEVRGHLEGDWIRLKDEPGFVHTTMGLKFVEEGLLLTLPQMRKEHDELCLESSFVEM